MKDLDLATMSEIELLQTHGCVIDELIRRGVAKTRNNPVGDYSEWLICRRFDLDMQANSKASFDAIDDSGIRYQIKSRRSESKSVQFSTIRNLEHKGFDFVIALVFNYDYSIRFAVMIPHEIIPRLAKYQPHVNGYNLILTDKNVKLDGVIDILSELA